MRGGALLVVCAVTACGGSGVVVEIFAPDGMQLDRVELWVAYDPCYDCPEGVGWQSDGERARGDIYYLRDEALVAAAPQGDRWVLHLDAVAGNRDPGWIAVAGYHGDQVTAIKVLRDVHIPSTTVAIWQVYLHAAEPASTDVTTAPNDAARDHRALVWARPPTPALAEPTGCLAYQAWNGDGWDTEYFVPPSDPDCDGIPPDRECSEFWYHYKPQGGRCATSDPTLAGACIAGVSACADGVSTDRSCHEDPTQLATCLPDIVCEQCSDAIPVDDCVTSAVEAGVAADSTLHFHCGFDRSIESTPCQDQKALLRLPRDPVPAAATCGTIALHYLDQPFGTAASELVFGTQPAQATFEVSTTDETCVYELTWTSGNQQAFANPVTFLIDVLYTNGTHAIYPVQILPTGQTIDCSAVPPLHDCTAGGPLDDGVTRCAMH